MSQHNSDTPAKRWSVTALFPDDLPPVLTDESLPTSTRDLLNYFCDVLHGAIAILDTEGSLPIKALCTSLRISQPEFRYIWATFYLGGFDALREEASHPTFHYTYDAAS